MKRLLLSIIFSLASVTLTLACEVCKKNQPKVLENITHGSGPTGTIDYVITWSALVIVVVTLYMSIRFLVRPKETGAEHIKNIILEEHPVNYGR